MGTKNQRDIYAHILCDSIDDHQLIILIQKINNGSFGLAHAENLPHRLCQLAAAEVIMKIDRL
jgi:hypothetical protein